MHWSADFKRIIAALVGLPLHFISNPINAFKEMTMTMTKLPSLVSLEPWVWYRGSLDRKSSVNGHAQADSNGQPNGLVKSAYGRLAEYSKVHIHRDMNTADNSC